PGSPAALPAALYFKNVAVAKWRGAGSKGRVQLPGGKEEQEAVRVQLVEVLLRCGQGKILNVLIEAFSAVVRTELASPSGWPQLLPGLKAALLSSDLIQAVGSASAAAPGPSDPASAAAATFSTVTVLTVLRAVTKPYRYFLDPTNDKEPVPPVLEAIASDLLLPLMPLMHHLIAAQAQQSSPQAHDEALLLILKTLHLSVQSHMPSAIRKHIDSIVPELLLLLSHCPPTLAAAAAAAGQEEGEVMDGGGGEEGGAAGAVWEVRLKGCKRALQICHSLASRHQKLTNKHFPAMVDGITAIVCNSLWTSQLPSAARRVIAVAFTAIAQVLDSAPGWKVVAPQFAHLLEAAIFPALCLHPHDLELWDEDEEEYVRRNLPTDLDDIDEIESYDPRQCAAHLLALIATSKGSPAKGKPGAAGAAAAAAGKSTSPAAGRRRQRRPAATKDTDAAAATVVLPFLSRFPLPADSPVPMEGMFVAGAGGGQAPANTASAAVVHYFGVLQAYAAMKEYFERQPAHLEQLLPAHVLPLFSQRHVSAVLLASATWLLGELSTALPESLHNPVYEASMKAMAAGDVDGQSWAAVRTAASHCISYLIQNDVEPSDWLAFLQAVVVATRAGEEREAVRALDLLESVAVEGGEGVHAHLPAIIAAVANDTCSALPPPEQPWSQRVWALFSALASLVESWADDELPGGDDDEEEEGEERGGKEAAGAEERSRRAVEVAASVARVLRVAWLNEPVDPSILKPQLSSQEAEEDKEPPPTSWFDASLLLSFVLKAAANAPAASPSTTAATAGAAIAGGAATGGDAAALVVQWGVVPLLHKWVDLVAEWTAWEEDEDEAVFQTIDSLLLLQGRTPLPDFISMAPPPPPLPPVPPRSILEGVACFVSSALSDGSPAATWRASRHSHTLLNAAAVALNGGPAAAALAARFAENTLLNAAAAVTLNGGSAAAAALAGRFAEMCQNTLLNAAAVTLNGGPAAAALAARFAEVRQEEGGEGGGERGAMTGVVLEKGVLGGLLSLCSSPSSPPSPSPSCPHSLPSCPCPTPTCLSTHHFPHLFLPPTPPPPALSLHPSLLTPLLQASLTRLSSAPSLSSIRYITKPLLLALFSSLLASPSSVFPLLLSPAPAGDKGKGENGEGEGEKEEGGLRLGVVVRGVESLLALHAEPGLCSPSRAWCSSLETSPNPNTLSCSPLHPPPPLCPLTPPLLVTVLALTCLVQQSAAAAAVTGSDLPQQCWLQRWQRCARPDVPALLAATMVRLKEVQEETSSMEGSEEGEVDSEDEEEDEEDEERRHRCLRALFSPARLFSLSPGGADEAISGGTVESTQKSTHRCLSPHHNACVLSSPLLARLFSLSPLAPPSLCWTRVLYDSELEAPLMRPRSQEVPLTLRHLFSLLPLPPGSPQPVLDETCAGRDLCWTRVLYDSELEAPLMRPRSQEVPLTLRHLFSLLPLPPGSPQPPALDENLDDAELEAALMRRYAEAAKMIGSLEEDKADVEDEYGVELELGLAGLQDEQAGIRACLQQHWSALGRQVVALKPSLSADFAQAFPPAKPFLL
ncbi:unnamed protein product, partial [Closterium sp. Naga37s-1]